jgi:hypothetical protein
LADVHGDGAQAIRPRKAGTGYRQTMANEEASLSHGRGRWFETSIAHSYIIKFLQMNRKKIHLHTAALLR